MSRLLSKIRSIGRELMGWLIERCAVQRILELENTLEKYRDDLEGTHLATKRYIAFIQEQRETIKWLRAQLINLRVAQAPQPRAGWEICAYIPEEVLKKMRFESPEILTEWSNRIAGALVKHALLGAFHVDAQGRVNALVFEPLNINGPARAPKWVQVLYDRGEGAKDRFHMSEHAELIDPGTPEERARRASGL